MSGVVPVLATAGHGAAAILFAVLAVWQASGRGRMLPHYLLALAFSFTSASALLVTIGEAYGAWSGVAENLRNLAFLGFLLVLLRRAGEERQSILAVYMAVGVVLALATGLSALRNLTADPELARTIGSAATLLQMIAIAGALVLVQNLYSVSNAQERAGIRLPLAALAAIWTYDLNLYTVAYLSWVDAGELFALRGIGLTLLCPVFALGLHRNAPLAVRLSRTMTLRSLSVAGILVYCLAIFALAGIAHAMGGAHARLAQVVLVFALSVGALLILPSARFRAWFKVKVAKHFFQHRYDYREEWLRFNRTIGLSGPDAPPLAARVVRAMADVLDAQAGLLLLPDPGGRLVVQHDVDWPDPAALSILVLETEAAAALTRAGRIIDLRDVQLEDPVLPDAFHALADAWVLVPLVHYGQLAGAILLGRPAVERGLDWEDRDMLHLVAQQLASYIAEAQVQEALSEARRFDEFNRRFAFIIHDIKNLVSQLNLVARNAERHANNPAFRADMIETLRGSVDKMNEMLARLGGPGRQVAEPVRPVNIGHLLERLAAQRARQHAFVIEAGEGLLALADAARLEQALVHLIQNAIDASASDAPVRLAVVRDGAMLRIDIRDQGAGMSAEFVRSQLFRAFSSTKPGGFGIGAHEARSMVEAMGGRIEVESREGQGSCFSLFLPAAEAGSLRAVQGEAA